MNRVSFLLSAVLALVLVTVCPGLAMAQLRAETALAEALALPVGTVVVEVRDTRGAPLSGKNVIATVRSSAGQLEERRVTSDASGDCLFADLPGDARHEVSFSFEDAGLVLARTSAIHLSPEAGQRLEMRLPALTEDQGKVEIRSYRAIFAKHHGRADVTLHLVLAAPLGAVFRSAKGYVVPLPEGALAPRVPGEDADEKVRIAAEHVAVLQPITAEPMELEVGFELEVEDGRVEYVHRLGRPLPMVQLLSTWTENGASLEGSGMPAAELREMPSGLVALATMNRDVSSGVVRGALNGLGAKVQERVRFVVLVLCLALLAMGIVAWARGRGERPGS